MAGGRGHAKPVRDSRLKSPAFAAMTGGAMRSFGRTGESRAGLGLRRSVRQRPEGYGRTGRNMFVSKAHAYNLAPAKPVDCAFWSNAPFITHFRLRRAAL